MTLYVVNKIEELGKARGMILLSSVHPQRDGIDRVPHGDIEVCFRVSVGGGLRCRLTSDPCGSEKQNNNTGPEYPRDCHVVATGWCCENQFNNTSVLTIRKCGGIIQG